MSMDDYMTLREVSAKWGISARRINTLCVEGRIKGAMRIGSMWVLPKDAKKPNVGRIKSGRYIKNIVVLEEVKHGDER
jgi:putative transposase